MTQKHYKHTDEGRSLEAMIGAYGYKTGNITTTDDLCHVARQMFDVTGFTLKEIHDAVKGLGRGARRKLAKAYLAQQPVRERPPHIPPQLARVYLDYTNYRGERSERLVTPIGIEFMASAFHKGPDGVPVMEWILKAYDHGKGKTREFAMKDIHSFKHLFEPAARFPRQQIPTDGDRSTIYIRNAAE